jgi:uncharacterized protein (DUF1015 family)
MAKILPFRAWRYNDSLAQNIGELTSPLFDVKTVCHSGSTLPQKSTYFWPKAICGFVFSSI